jgi:hypothetical protein
MNAESEEDRLASTPGEGSRYCSHTQKSQLEAEEAAIRKVDGCCVGCAVLAALAIVALVAWATRLWGGLR